MLLLVGVVVGTLVYGLASAVGQTTERQAGATVEPVAASDFLNSLSEAERVWLRAHPVIRVAQDPELGRRSSSPMSTGRRPA